MGKISLSCHEKHYGFFNNMSFQTFAKKAIGK